MNETNNESLLREGALQAGIILNDKQTAHFLKYMEILKEWNEKINLTAIENDRDIIIKHFIDSLSILPLIKNHISANLNGHDPDKYIRSGYEPKFIDIGTGAGFPGIPLKIVYDGLNITLLDSLAKRVQFLQEVINTLELTGITALHGRAEDLGAMQQYREKYDISTARALAGLPVLLEYCLPFVKTGGIFIAMKGSSTEEIGISAKALDILGGKIEDIKEISLPFDEIKRNLITIKKLRQTPTNYPRKAGKPSKAPLI